MDDDNGAWLADQLIRTPSPLPGTPIVLAETRRHAEDSTHRFLTTALTDAAPAS